TEMPYEKIRVLHGSTSHVKEGYGSYHSRATVMGGSAILLAAEKLKQSIKTLAAKRLGCAAEDVVLDGDEARGGNRSIGFAELSDVPLEVEAEFFNNKQTWAYGTHAAHVAVDLGTYHVKLLDYMAVEDVGRTINPATLHGQAIGSIVQGLGGALLEHLVYDENKAYPAIERAGVVWVYMGSRAQSPPLPAFEILDVPEDEVGVLLIQRDCNYLQALEGDIDTSHFGFLH